MAVAGRAERLQSRGYDRSRFILHERRAAALHHMRTMMMITMLSGRDIPNAFAPRSRERGSTRDWLGGALAFVSPG